MLRLIIDVLVTSGLLYALATALPGVRLKSFGTALIVVLVYGLLNYFLFWLIALIAFIPMLLSFGLFGLVINAFLLWLTDKLIDDFEIDSIRMTLVMAVLLTVGKVVLRAILLRSTVRQENLEGALASYPLPLVRVRVDGLHGECVLATTPPDVCDRFFEFSFHIVLESDPILL